MVEFLNHHPWHLGGHDCVHGVVSTSLNVPGALNGFAVRHCAFKPLWPDSLAVRACSAILCSSLGLSFLVCRARTVDRFFPSLKCEQN